MDLKLAGKRALVTGGSSGLGEGISLALGKAGAKVAVNYRSHPEAADAIKGQIETAGGEATTFQADVTDSAGVAAMFAHLDSQWGGIDLLVNCAGIDGPRADSWECDPDQWRRVLEINLIGAFSCSREALRRMIPQKSGVVLNITSVHEKIAWSGYSAYTASKAGLSMLTKTMAQEAGPHGVRVVSLAPGAIRTPINKSVWSDPAQMKDLMSKIPLDRIGEVDDVAKMAVMLLSDAAGYVTGTTVFVDGGMTDYPSFEQGG
ncbi:Glucose 1-dehydrogenase 1 [Pirellulimonas nuda]|uniref:Glucose 1-dehydrogenase 1 n=1 Tax=Pirellulimonas nuda TaxID=2528009 RepID=A0A518D8U7_9BACT|nr:glucose 1-dehydrogenase [Pirellulimonas nuda]QDU87902.1 Glucose 1-dehydrogenase 1 [Pirellulimonas nuda]